jgi:hypothetical protein
MPLSRHFYSLDEVQAALLYTTARFNPSESLFWCQEMLLSGCVGEAISTLFQSWLWNTGPTRLQWLIEAWKTLASDELSEDDILLNTYRLATIHHSQRDTSLWNILVLTSQNPDEMPDTITRKSPLIYPSSDEKEIYFICTMFQGKAHSAWWITQFIDTDRVWNLLYWYTENIHTKYRDHYTTCLEALKNYEKLLGYQTPEYDTMVRAAAVFMMCLDSNTQEQSFKPLLNEIDKSNAQTLNELDAAVGRRERRLYSIPSACLYGTTVRGCSKWSQHNFTQLYNVEKYLVGCPFWDEVLAEYAEVSDEGDIKWLNDDKLEEFYEKYFPDDIPDEWSKKDQLKSHGDGVLGPKDKPSMSKYSRSFLSKNPRLAWNTSRDVNKYLEQLNINDCNVEQIIKLSKQHLNRTLPPQDLKKLLPVHKIKTV